MTTPRIEENKSGASFQRRFDRNIEWAFRAINDDGEDINDTLNILRTNLLALHDKALTEAHQAGIDEAVKDKRKLLDDFAEFAHTRYLGTDGKEYAYSQEVVYLVEDYLAIKALQDKK